MKYLALKVKNCVEVNYEIMTSLMTTGVLGKISTFISKPTARKYEISSCTDGEVTDAIQKKNALRKS